MQVSRSFLLFSVLALAGAYMESNAIAQTTPTNAEVSSIDAVVGQVKQALADVQTALSDKVFLRSSKLNSAFKLLQPRKVASRLSFGSLTSALRTRRTNHSKSILFSFHLAPERQSRLQRQRLRKSWKMPS